MSRRNVRLARLGTFQARANLRLCSGRWGQRPAAASFGGAAMRRYVRFGLAFALVLALAVLAGGTPAYAWTGPAALNTNAATDSGDDSAPQVTTDGAGHWVAVWMSAEAWAAPSARTAISSSRARRTTGPPGRPPPPSTPTPRPTRGMTRPSGDDRRRGPLGGGLAFQ